MSKDYVTIKIPICLDEINDEAAIGSSRIDLKVPDLEHRRVYHRLFKGMETPSEVKAHCLRNVLEAIRLELVKKGVM